MTNRDRPFNAGNRKDVRGAEKKQLISLVIRGEVITGVMSVANGRQWMHELLAATHVFTDPFSPDPYIHAANSGQRGIGLQLFNDIMAFCPSQFTLMIEESHVRNASSERARGPNGDRGIETPGFDDSGTDNGFDYSLHRDEEGNPAFDGYTN